jgi:hypothetical protein
MQASPQERPQKNAENCGNQEGGNRPEQEHDGEGKRPRGAGERGIIPAAAVALPAGASASA